MDDVIVWEEGVRCWLVDGEEFDGMMEVINHLVYKAGFTMSEAHEYVRVLIMEDREAV